MGEGNGEFFCLAKQHKQATGLIEQGEEKEGGSEEVEG